MKKRNLIPQCIIITLFTCFFLLSLPLIKNQLIKSTAWAGDKGWSDAFGNSPGKTPPPTRNPGTSRGGWNTVIDNQSSSPDTFEQPSPGKNRHEKPNIEQREESSSQPQVQEKSVQTDINNLHSSSSKQMTKKLPLPKLIPYLSEFRLKACISPQQAFDKYSSPSAHFNRLSNILNPGSNKNQGWQYFFGTSVTALTSLSEKSVLSIFYCPWSDIALICQWINGDNGIVISDTELVTGDCIRKSKSPELIPLWQRDLSIPPQLAIIIATNDTIMAFLKCYNNRHESDPNNWRNRLPSFKTQEQIDGNHQAVNILAIHSLLRDSLYNEKPLKQIREEMDNVRDLLLSGQITELLTIAKQTTKENCIVLEKIKFDWSKFTIVSLATDKKNAFVFVSNYFNPEYIFCFWFKVADRQDALLEKPELSRIDFISHTLSANEVERLANQAGIR